MKKKLLYLLAVSMFFMQTYNVAFSKTNLSNPVRIAIKKYKTGNYTGCLQDCKNIIVHDPSNAVAYYYLAMSYAQAGDKNNAVKAYSKVLSLSPNARLSQYAETGKRCLESPDKCHDDGTGASPDPAMDKFISKDQTVSDKVQQGFQERALKNLQYDINKDKDIDNYQLNQFKQRSDAPIDTKIAQNKPTDAEIVKALRVLNAAGLNPYAQQQTQPQGQMQQSDNTVNNIMPFTPPQQSPEMAQISAMLNQGNSNNNNNQMMNMLPYMMMQNKDGSSNYSPQLMQAVIMNSMMPNLDFDTNKDK